MPTLTFIEHNGTVHQVHAEVGQSVMQAATFGGVPGLPADCGGACACATCHTYVDAGWIEHVGAAEGAEKDMLDYVPELRATSRLSCQIVVSAEMDGMTLQLPESQY